MEALNNWFKIIFCFDSDKGGRVARAHEITIVKVCMHVVHIMFACVLYVRQTNAVWDNFISCQQIWNTWPSPALLAGGKLCVKTLGGIHSNEYDFWAKKLRITKRCNGALKSKAQNCQKTSNSTFVVVSKHNLAFCGQQQEFMRVVATNLHLAGDHPNPEHFF